MRRRLEPQENVIVLRAVLWDVVVRGVLPALAFGLVVACVAWSCSG